MTRAATVQARLATAPRRLISRVDAAIYIGVSPSAFDALVREGKMPTPRLISGRNVWDIRDLDRAIDELPYKGGGSWEDV